MDLGEGQNLHHFIEVMFKMTWFENELKNCILATLKNEKS